MRRKNILIEQITSNELADLETRDLRDLRSRFINIFDKYFLDSDLQKAAGMERKDFVTKYMLLRKEMDKRKINFFRRLPIDKELGGRVFKSLMWGLDIGTLGDMLVIPDYICVSGDFIKSPKKAGKIEVIHTGLAEAFAQIRLENPEADRPGLAGECNCQSGSPASGSDDSDVFHVLNHLWYRSGLQTQEPLWPIWKRAIRWWIDPRGDSLLS